MNISIISAMTKDKIIGVKNNLPWRIKEELQYFKQITLNKVIIMGSNTFSSINSKPLPNRYNIVVTKNPKKFSCVNQYDNYDNISFVSTIEASLKQAERFYTRDDAEDSKEIMVIGGGAIYKQFLPLASKLYLSIIKNNYIGDVYFPEYDLNLWRLASTEEYAEFIAQIWVLAT